MKRFKANIRGGVHDFSRDVSFLMEMASTLNDFHFPLIIFKVLYISRWIVHKIEYILYFMFYLLYATNVLFSNLWYLMKGAFFWNIMLRKQPSRGVIKKRCSENMQQIYRRTPRRSVISIKLQNHTSAWVISCKFAA